MTTFDLGWMDADACAAPGHRGLPWHTDTDTLPAVLVELMRGVCATCPVAVDCAGYVSQAGITGGFWAGSDRDPHHNTRRTVRLRLDDLLEPDVLERDVLERDVLERDVLEPDVLGGAA